MIITQTPLRISFLGGGTDFPDYYNHSPGCVLTAAIDKYVYCIVKERFDDMIVVGYTKKEIVEKVSQLEHELVREAMRKTGIEKGIEITFLSDIPAAGSGLGSSSSVTVGVLNALYQLQGKAVSAQVLASQACDIEIKILGKPIGVQDQYIAAFGGLRFIDFSKKGIEVNGVRLGVVVRDKLNRNLMVFYTGTTRKAESILEEQKQNISSKKDVLKKLAAAAREGKKLLANGQIELFGQLLEESWKLKKLLASGITNNQIDNMYRISKKAGALGGKISGAGGGGFLTLIVPPDKHDAVISALAGYRHLPVNLSRDGSKVIFNINK